MAMTESGMSSAILSAIQTYFTASGSQGTTWQTQFADALGKAIVDYIQANATVTVNGTATGVTSGSSTAPVTGTGTIS